VKLLYCSECGDIRKLNTKSHQSMLGERDRVECSCGQSWGWYEEDGLHAVIGGKAIPLGIHNFLFVLALDADKRADGEPRQFGEKFEAFVIPMPCPTVRREGK
jgi:hypothetical protein